MWWGDVDTYDGHSVAYAVADAPSGPFAFRGQIINSDPDYPPFYGTHHSIDQFYVEDNGKPYLFWGSFRGLYAAELINVLRDNDPELMLFCVTPYEEQATKWTPELRERYFDMMIKCTHMTAVSLHKQPDAQLKAYRTIIRQSDMVLAVYDPASARGDDTDKAISYARELRRPMLMIHPDTLKTTYSCVEV